MRRNKLEVIFEGSRRPEMYVSGEGWNTVLASNPREGVDRGAEESQSNKVT